MIMYKYLFIIFYLSLVSLVFSSSNNYYSEIQEKLILAQPGDTIFLPNGYIDIERGLLGDNLNDVVIIGHGIDKTILSFI